VGKVLGECHAHCRLNTSSVDFQKSKRIVAVIKANLQSLNHVIIINTKVLPPRAYVIVVDFCYH
jgi:hypothetical protein